MKKMIMAVAIVCAAALANAASVGWSLGGASAYAGDAYKFFVIGQNNVADIATVTSLLNAGTDVSSYQYGAGNIASTGAANQPYGTSGKTLGAGSYEAFFVVFDSASPTAGKSNYAVISGVSTLKKTLTDSTPSVTFAGGNAGTVLNNASNWHSFGSAGPVAPEPTSGLLLLLGMAGLALKRKHA